MGKEYDRGYMPGEWILTLAEYTRRIEDEISRIEAHLGIEMSQELKGFDIATSLDNYREYLSAKALEALSKGSSE